MMRFGCYVQAAKIALFIEMTEFIMKKMAFNVVGYAILYG